MFSYSRFVPSIGLVLGLTLGLGAAALGIVGCEDSASPTPPRDPRIVLIPLEWSLEQAGTQAIAGDTLRFVGSVSVAGTVVFESNQTPLLLEGARGQTVISGGSDSFLIRFESPRPGTRVSQLGFSGGSPTVEVTGTGEISFEECTFRQGNIQIQATGSGLHVDVSRSLLRDAAFFSLDLGGTSTLTARENTIDQAGDCGIRLADQAVGDVRNCIIWRSLGYGIACLGSSSLADSSGCNDVPESGQAPYLGCTGPAGDFTLAPEFCDPDGGDYALQPTSPCAPLNSGGCGLIGAFSPSTCPAP